MASEGHTRTCLIARTGLVLLVRFRASSIAVSRSARLMPKLLDTAAVQEAAVHPDSTTEERLSSILKIILRYKLLKTQDIIAWLAVWDSNGPLLVLCRSATPEGECETMPTRLRTEVLWTDRRKH